VQSKAEQNLDLDERVIAPIYVCEDAVFIAQISKVRPWRGLLSRLGSCSGRGAESTEHHSERERERERERREHQSCRKPT
jgi:hypothetical protein